MTVGSVWVNQKGQALEIKELTDEFVFYTYINGPGPFQMKHDAFQKSYRKVG